MFLGGANAYEISDGDEVYAAGAPPVRNIETGVGRGNDSSTFNLYHTMQPQPPCPSSVGKDLRIASFGVQHHHSHRLIWVVHAVIGVIAITALIIAVTKTSSAHGCICDPTSSASSTAIEAYKADGAALQANISALHLEIQGFKTAEAALNDLTANFTELHELVHTPPPKPRTLSGSSLEEQREMWYLT